MSAGIYCIRCEINDKIYVGQSKNIGNRWKQHKTSLEKDEHINHELQEDYNNYGLDAFVFSVLEIIENNDNLQKQLFAREKYWGDKLGATSDNGYNKAEFSKINPSKYEKALEYCWKGSNFQKTLTYLCYHFSPQVIPIYLQIKDRIGYAGWSGYPLEDDCLAVFTLEEIARTTNLSEQKVLKFIKELDKKELFTLMQNTHDKNKYAAQFEEVGNFDEKKWKVLNKNKKVASLRKIPKPLDKSNPVCYTMTILDREKETTL